MFQLVDQELAVIQESDFVPVSDSEMAAVRDAAVQGHEQIILHQIICQGWPPNIKQVPACLKTYWNFRDTMHVQDGIVYKGGQVVVPKKLRVEFLQRLHSSHQGLQSTLRRARDAMYWLGMVENIRRITVNCSICEKDSPAQSKQPQLSHSIPKKAWEKVGMDLFCWKGKSYLVIEPKRKLPKSISPGMGFLLQYTQVVVFNSHIKSSKHL